MMMRVSIDQIRMTKVQRANEIVDNFNLKAFRTVLLSLLSSILIYRILILIEEVLIVIRILRIKVLLSRLTMVYMRLSFYYLLNKCLLFNFFIVYSQLFDLF